MNSGFRDMYEYYISPIVRWYKKSANNLYWFMFLIYYPLYLWAGFEIVVLILLITLVSEYIHNTYHKKEIDNKDEE